MSHRQNLDFKLLLVIKAEKYFGIKIHYPRDGENT